MNKNKNNKRKLIEIETNFKYQFLTGGKNTSPLRSVLRALHITTMLIYL